jgi:hypothetical protein
MDDIRPDLDKLVSQFADADDHLKRYRSGGPPDDLLAACAITCTALTDLGENNLFWVRVNEAIAAAARGDILPTTLDDIDAFGRLEDKLLEETGRPDVARKVLFDITAAIDFVGKHPGQMETANLRARIRDIAEEICETRDELQKVVSEPAEPGWRGKLIHAGRLAVRGVRVLAGAVETGYDAAAILHGLITPEHGLSLVSGIETIRSGLWPCRD